MKSPRTRRRIVGLALVLVVSLLGWSILRRPASGPPRHYVTAPVERLDLTLRVTATGSLQPTTRITVGSEMSGTAAEVLVDTNDQVKQGQLLARLDPTKFEQEVERSRASLLSAKAKVDLAETSVREQESNLQRLLKLHELSQGATPSPADLDATRAALDRARAETSDAKASVAQAEADLKVNQSNLERTEIRSPVDGLVLTRNIEPGQTVAAQFQAPELFVIAENLNTMELEVHIAEADIGSISAGQKASFQVDAWPSDTFAATLSKVSYGSETTDNVVTYPAELRVENPDLKLRPGMTATADIEVRSSPATLAVPTKALRFQPGEASGEPQAENSSFIRKLVPAPPRPQSKGSNQNLDFEDPVPGSTATVWILRDSRPTPVEVTVGLTGGKYTEVSSPLLEEGSQVITAANATQP